MDISSAEWIKHGITVLLLATALAWVYNAAQRHTLLPDPPHVVRYTREFLWGIVVGGWTFTAVLAVLAEMTAKDDDLGPAAGAVALFIALLLPLHLEAFRVRIVWDEQGMHTRSPWRRPRDIAFSEVVSCDYSSSMKWYRIRTRRQGIVRLHWLMQGIPELLAQLPCDAPPYPPEEGGWKPGKRGKG